MISKLFKKLYLLVMAFVALIVPKGECFDAAMHMAIAKRTLEIWQNYDTAFYNAMTKPLAQVGTYRRWQQLMTRKFFYIGTTLPDLFWEGTQATVASLIEELYENRSSFSQPLHILTSTYNMTRERIIFNHHNVSILSKMADYARRRNWNVYTKALIMIPASFIVIKKTTVGI